MISQRLLNEFISENDTIIITNIECDYDSCGQEVLKIDTKKISKPYLSVIKNYDVVNKTLEVEGHLNLNDDKEYYTNLVGFISNESLNEVNESVLTEGDILNNLYRSPTSHHIEVVETTLKKEINIEFNTAYSKMPNVIITIDKKDENIYNSYSTEFIKDSYNNYTGVKVSFSNLKSKNSYPKINIAILGDPIQSYYDGLISTEAPAIIHLYEKIEEDNIDIKNTKITLTNEAGVNTSYTSDNCGKITSILEYGTYTVKIDDSNYDETKIYPIEVSTSDNYFDLKFEKKETVTEGE